MAPDDKTDARKHTRTSLEVPIVVTGTDSKGSSFLETSATYNVSNEGLCLILRHQVDPEQELLIQRRNGIMFRASVKWVNPVPPNHYRVGCQFAPLPSGTWNISKSAC